MTNDLPRLPLGLAAGALGCGVVGAVLALGAQAAHAGAGGLGPSLHDLELVRDFVLGVLVPALLLGALGRTATTSPSEAAPSEVLARTERLAGWLGVAGAALVAVAVPLSGEALRLVAASGVALVAMATTVDVLGLLGRAPATPQSWTSATQRAASLAAVGILPMTAAVLALTVAGRLTHRPLFRDLDDLRAVERAIRDAAAAFPALALFLGAGRVLDALAAAAGRPWVGVASTRFALRTGVVLAIAAYAARLFAGPDVRGLAAAALPTLLLAVPCTVVLGNGLATLAAGRLVPGAIGAAPTAALVLLVERIALGFTEGLLVLRGELPGSSAEAGAAELSLAALVFLVATTRKARAPLALAGAGLAAFGGVQLLLLSRLATSALPRGVAGLRSLLTGERVAALGLLLVIAAAVPIGKALLDQAAAARRPGR